MATLWGATLVVGLAILWANPNYQWSTLRDEPYGADFLQEWCAGHMMLEGSASQLYDRTAFDSRQHDASHLGFEWSHSNYYPAVYPPIYYAIVAPIAAFPYRWAVPIWLGLLLTAYAVSGRLHAGRPWWSALNRSRSKVDEQSWYFWTVCLLLPAMFTGCVMGQKGTLWLLILVGSWQLLRAQHAVASGALSALLILKPTLAPVLVCAMLLNGKWRYCIGFVLGAVGLLIISWVWLPSKLWSDYFDVVLGTVGYQDHSGYRTGWSTSLITLYQSLGLPRSVVIMLWIISSGVILWSVTRATSWQRTNKQVVGPHLPEATSGGLQLPIEEDPYWLFSVLLATALISPHFYYYDLVWLVFPLCGIWRRCARQGLECLMLLWIGILTAQQWENGFPILSLCVITLLVKYRRQPASLSRRVPA